MKMFSYKIYYFCEGWLDGRAWKSVKPLQIRQIKRQ